MVGQGEDSGAAGAWAVDGAGMEGLETGSGECPRQDAKSNKKSAKDTGRSLIVYRS